MRIQHDKPLILKVFGEYLINIINDKDEGLHLLEKYEQLLNQEKQQQKDNYFELLNEPVALAIISNKRNEIGQFTYVNLLFSSLFGFQKEEVIGKRIQLIMPLLYSGYHEDFMHKFQEKLQLGEESEYLQMEQYRMGKCKNDYIFPLEY